VVCDMVAQNSIDLSTKFTLGNRLFKVRTPDP
jgi:hypothetical protein